MKNGRSEKAKQRDWKESSGEEVVDEGRSWEYVVRNV